LIAGKDSQFIGLKTDSARSKVRTTFSCLTFQAINARTVFAKAPISWRCSCPKLMKKFNTVTLAPFDMKRAVRTSLVKRMMKVAGKRRFVGVEAEFWKRLKHMADQRGATIPEVVAEIDSQIKCESLSKAVRLFIEQHYRAAPKLVPDQEPTIDAGDGDAARRQWHDSRG
jgi:predicted DNA-binding ribbon-helix-helix protein